MQVSSCEDPQKNQQQQLVLLQHDEQHQPQQQPREGAPAAATANASSVPQQQVHKLSSRNGSGNNGKSSSSSTTPSTSRPSDTAAPDALGTAASSSSSSSMTKSEAVSRASLPRTSVSSGGTDASSASAASRAAAREAAGAAGSGAPPLSLTSKVPRGVWFNRSTGCWLACVSGVGKRLHVFSSKRYGHERAFQMAVNCKEADRAQAAAGAAGSQAGSGGVAEGGPHDIFATSSARGSASAAAGGSRRSRTASGRRQQQHHPLAMGSSPGRGPGVADTEVPPAIQQGDGDDEDALDSATDTRTEESAVGRACCYRATAPGIQELSASAQRGVVSFPVGRGAEAAANGLYSAVGVPDEGGLQRGGGALCSGSGSMKSLNRTGSGLACESLWLAASLSLPLLLGASAYPYSAVGLRLRLRLFLVPKGVWFNSHTKSWTCTTAGPKRQLLVFSSNRFGFAEARRMAISARLASLKLEGLPVPHCPLLYETPIGLGAPGGPPEGGAAHGGGPGAALGGPSEGWGGLSPHEGGEDGYGGTLVGSSGNRRRRKQKDGISQFVNCKLRRGEAEEYGHDPWDPFRTGLPFVAEKPQDASTTGGGTDGLPLRRLCASERRLLEVGSIALELLLKDLLRLCGEELAGAAACFSFPIFAAIRKALNRVQRASDPLHFQSIFKALAVCMRSQQLPSQLTPRRQAELLARVLAAEKVYKKEQRQQPIGDAPVASTTGAAAEAVGGAVAVDASVVANGEAAAEPEAPPTTVYTPTAADILPSTEGAPGRKRETEAILGDSKSARIAKDMSSDDTCSSLESSGVARNQRETDPETRQTTERGAAADTTGEAAPQSLRSHSADAASHHGVTSIAEAEVVESGTTGAALPEAPSLAAAMLVATADSGAHVDCGVSDAAPQTLKTESCSTWECPVSGIGQEGPPRGISVD
ncbi:hypothetical protein cyc_00519 [Cyclospora cayetanensis]|uniref:AP2-coincident C-terminal domain-containing protein n=1 Tax=Cyclospora cayetanensis TaxID=88456 RepID=A0A1D3D8J8_9EIME|nr:hypothetical protein cyc_00519 [Cyclospora cayetanensis]